MQCRPACGACCVAPSITRAYHGMPRGKPAGVPCVHLDGDLRCGLFGDPRRPDGCSDFEPEPRVCGDSREQALATLAEWEVLTRPEQVAVLASDRLTCAGVR
jgi:uncharacterized protein